VALFSVVLIVPLLVAFAAFLLTKEVDWRELLLIIGAQAIVAGISAGICYYSNTTDTEVWNGVVTGKAKVSVPCSHSYQCHCHEECSGSGKNRSCSEHCDTCYEHFNDYDWDVYTSNQETITIDRIDRQGSSMPGRWEIIKTGEPTSVAHSYTNYVKASPDSLFRYQGQEQKYEALIPNYPDSIYDYYKLDRLVLVNGASVADPDLWNADLRRLNADIGSQKQVNIIVIVVRNLPEEFFYAVEEKWIGSKKNDVVLVVGVDSTNAPKWVQVMAWTINPIFEVKLRNAILAKPVIQRWDVISELKVNILKYHNRKPMADFEYLKASIVPSTTQWVVTLIVGFIVACGMTWYMLVNDVFGTSSYQRFRNNW
jgi:hypothetical protein